MVRSGKYPTEWWKTKDEIRFGVGDRVGARGQTARIGIGGNRAYVQLRSRAERANSAGTLTEWDGATDYVFAELGWLYARRTESRSRSDSKV